MVYINSKYGTNHPKDVAARRMQRLMRIIKEQGCTNRELHQVTEPNVRKCMKEMQTTASAGEQFKRDAKFLGEESDLNKQRRAK